MVRRLAGVEVAGISGKIGRRLISSRRAGCGENAFRGLVASHEGMGSFDSARLTPRVAQDDRGGRRDLQSKEIAGIRTAEVVRRNYMGAPLSA